MTTLCVREYRRDDVVVARGAKHLTVGNGANDPRQMVFRPRVALNPYATGIKGVYLCSSSTAPGAGVHGMSGMNAARAAMAKELRSA